MQAPTPKILLALGRRTAVGPSLSLLKHPHKLHFLSSISLCSSSTRKNHKPKKNPSSLFPRFLKNLPKIQMKAENNESCGELKKGPWTAAEDAILMEYVRKHGEGNWNSVQKNCGLMRCGKSCRLRWTNHLRPNLKKGAFSPEEERVILEMHAKLGNKWARMAAQLPGRTDNEIKNYWNTRLKRRQRAGTLPFPQGMHKQGAHNHQPYSSPVPTPTIQFSSLHQPNYGSLSIFDQINMSPLTSLQSHQQFQSNGIGFSLPFSSNLPPISTPQNQSFQTQCAQASTYQFSSNNYNLYSSPYLRTSFEPDGIGPPAPSSAFSIKLELPSSQLSEAAATTAALGTPIDYNISLPLPRSNSGLLDALVQEGTAMPSGAQHKLEENCDSDALGTNNLPCGGVFLESNTNPPAGARSQWVDFNPTDEVKMKKEPIDELISVEGDLSSMLDIIPSTMSIPNWGYSNSSEISNGQSSGLTDDDINLEMQQLVSSLPPMNTTDQNWTLGIWNNMPRIC